MRRRLWLLGLGVLGWMCVFAQPATHNVVSGEYFWNTDPGQGNGIAITATDASFNEVIEAVLANNAVVPATAGPHVFKLRVRDANGGWSPVFSTVVSRDLNASSVRTSQVLVAEYFWDTDPGQGAGSPLIALDGNLDEALESVLATATPPSTVGPHKFNVRVQDANNQWSPVFSTLVEVELSDAALRSLQVTQAEYFWDTDPGEGAGNPLIALDGGLNEAIEALLGNALPFPASTGAHRFFVRVKAADGQWSTTFSTLVYRDQNTATLRGSQVLVAEYYWDTDPGLGNGTPLLALDGNLNEAVETVLGNGISVPTPQGGHTFNLRVQDTDGNWSPAFTTLVYQDTLNQTLRPTSIVQAEYFWDTDPGEGGGVPFLAADGNLNEALEALLANGVGFPVVPGGHTFNVRVKAVDGQWSNLFSTLVFRDELSAAAPVQHIAQAEYFWDTDPGEGNGNVMLARDGALNEAVEALLSNVNTSSMSGGPHRFHVRVRAATGDWTPPFVTLVHVQGGFFPVDSIAGQKGFCGTVPTTVRTYRVDTTGIGNNSFNWTAQNGVITAGQGTSQVTVLWTQSQPIYTLTAITCAFGVCDTITDTIDVYSLPIANAGTDVAICVGASTQLNGSGGGNYLWTPSTGLSNTAIANPVASPTTSTAYVLRVTDNNTCVDLDTVNVTVNPLPLANAGNDTTICVGGTATLKATGGVSYQWSPTTGLSNPSASITAAQPSINTTYTVTVTDANGCQSTDAVTVSIDNGPVVSAGADVSICVGGATTLSGTAGLTSYSWTPVAGLSDPSIRNPLATPSATTLYTLAGSNARGCINTDAVLVTVNPLPNVDAGADVIACQGSGVTLGASGANTYAWSPSTGLSNPNIANPIATPTLTTTYTVTGTGANGCQNTDAVIVTVNALPVAEAGMDVTICAGDSTKLTATGGITYTWTPPTGLSNPNIHNPWAKPLVSTNYILTVTDANSCTDRDTVRVNVSICSTTMGKAIQAGEYYWDTDPGQGNGFALSATDGAFGEAVEAVLANNLNMPSTTGAHVLYVRVRDFRNIWSPSFRRVVTVRAGNISTRDHKVVEAEYFWDIDPGQGAGNPLLALDGNLNQALEAVYQNGINLPVTTGPHTFNVRVKDVDGNWGPIFRTTVQRLPRTGFNRDLMVTQAEYFWDTDPGQGNGITMLAFDGNLDDMVEALLANPVNIPSAFGPHAFQVRVQDADGNWSTAFKTIVVTDSVLTGIRPLQITQAEFFWDTDPGQGAATPMLVTDGNLDEAIEALFTNGVPVPVTVGSHSFNVRTRDAAGLWSPLFTTIVYQGNTQAGLREQKVVQAEYFWDTDPGLGNGTAMLAVDGALDEAVENLLRNGVSFPTALGPHSFYVRVKDVDNQWTVAFQTVVVRGENTVGTRPMHIVQAEYFWNNDPGQGNGIAMLAVDGTLNEVVENLFRNGIAMPAPQGMHQFNVRVKDASNNWSTPFTTLVYRDSITVGTRPMQLVQAEYFWNNDPGQGNGISMLATDGNLNEIVEALFRSNLALPTPQGNHVFNVRVKDVDSQWSDVFRTLVVRDSVTVGTRDMKLVTAEYYWNADPGQGNGTSVLAVDGNLNEMVEALFRTGISIPAYGPQAFHVRTQDVDGQWSEPFKTIVVRDSIHTQHKETYVARGEYYWDIDPGVGNGIAMLAVDGSYNEAVENLFRQINVLPLTDALHILGVRVQDVNGNWSPVFRRVVYINLPDIFVQDSISGDFEFCGTPQGPAQIYQITSVPNVNYQWTATGGTIASGQGSSAIQVNWGPTGPYILQLVGCVGTVCDTLRDTLLIHPLPTVVTSPNTGVCPGQSTQLSASGGVSYFWSPATGLNNRFLQNPVAQPTVTTTYTVLVTDIYGCQNTGSVTVSMQAPFVADAGRDTSICLGQSVQLQATGGLTYVWQPAAFLNNPNIANPIATPTVTTTFLVTASDGTGCSDTDTVRVAVGDLPPQIVCPAPLVVSNDAGQCNAVVNYVAPVGYDNCGGTTTIRIAGLGTGATFPIGTTTETYRVTDGQNNTATCSFSVTVEDHEAPVLACPTDTILSNDPNQCGRQLTYTLPTATDNCAGTTVTRISGPASGSFLNTGTYTIRFQATDLAGNRDTCEWRVEIRDTQTPIAICSNSLTVSTVVNQCGSPVSFSNTIWTDNCAGGTVQQIAGLNSGAFFPIGTTQQAYIVTDLAGNQDTCSFTVTVVDDRLPQITCPANITLNNATGQCGATATYTAPVGTDNCPGAQTAQTAGSASGTFFPVGLTTNTFTVTDAAGNTQSCSFNVTVQDVEAPLLTCPSNIVLQNDPDSCGAAVTYTLPTFTDNCAGGTMTMFGGLASGTHFPVGNTNVGYIATDASGLRDTCVFSVNIVDATYPVVICPDDTTLYTNSTTCNAQFFYSITAYDNCTRDSLVRTAGLPSGAIFPLGTTLNSYKIIDASFNMDSCHFVVTVIDSFIQTLNCPANISVSGTPNSIPCSAIVNFSLPSYTDNCAGVTLTQTSGLTSGSAFPQGVTTNTYLLTDVSGNTSTCTFTVTVGPCNQRPVAICQNLTLNANSNCQAVAAATAFSNGSFDPDGHPLTYQVSPAGPYALGTTAVTLIVSDPYGGADTCTANITVLDNTGPSITCPSSITVNNTPGTCGAVVTYTQPVGTDNCSGVTTLITAGQVSNTNFVVGTTTNTYTATDGAGNTTSCSFNVTVIDNEFPTITCPSTIIRANDPGICGAVVTYVQPFANDNCAGETLILWSGLPSGSTFGVGTSTVTYRVRDAVGHDAFCSFQVIVSDIEQPEIICPSNIVTNSDAGGCGAVVTYTTPVGTDNCAGANTVLTSGLASGQQFPGGLTNVIYTVLDNAGNQATCTFSVTVLDNANPQITCPASITVNNDLNACGAVVTYPTPSGTDQCSSASTTQLSGLASGATFPVGTTTNTFAVTDLSNNTASCSFTVTVVDAQAPFLTCPSNLFLNTSASQCDTVVTYNAPIGTDNCAGVSTAQTGGLPSGSVFGIGNTVQTFTATDAAGNTTSCSFSVTVIDQVLPQLTCPATINIGTDPGLCGAVVNFVTPVGTDNCAGVTTIRTHGLASGSFFPRGSTTQTYVTTDAFGNSRTCSFFVNVADDEAPGLQCPATITVNSALGGCGQTVNYTAPVGTDNCGGGHTGLTAGLSSGSFFPMGNTTVTYTAVDGSGNTTSCSFTVTVNDNELPSIACPANISINNDLHVCGALVNYTPPVGTDNCSAAATLLVSGLGTGAVFPVGISTETYSVTDSAGNTATCSFTITVADAQNPSIVCPNDIYINALPGTCSAIANYVAPVGTDNCTGATTTQIQGPGSGASFPIGAHVEIFQVRDAVGRTDTCHLRITIIDNELPQLSCPSNLMVNNDPGQCGAVVNYPVPVGTDNCAGATTVLVSGLASGDAFPRGTTHQVYRVTDAFGNQATCGFDVTVVDAEVPNIVCPAAIVVPSAAGGCGNNVSFVTPVGTDNCAGAQTVRTSGLASGSLFTVGVTTQTYVVTDGMGFTAQCSFTVEVQDNETPTITCPASIVVNNDLNACGSNVGYVTPVGIDNCNTSTTTQIAGLPSGTFFPVGITQNTFVVGDPAGNQDTCGFLVTVIDAQKPTLQCPANFSLNIQPGQCTALANYITPLGFDNCAGVSTVQSEGLPSGSLFPVGTNVQTFVATDSVGNIDSCSFAIFVIDNELPQIVCPTDTTVPNTPGQCNAVVVYATPVGTDNCAGSVTQRIAGLASGATFPKGLTQQIYQVTDQYGNTATCSFNVRVIDTERPNINCQADVTVNAQPGGCGAVVNFTMPVGTDNCTSAQTVLASSFGAGAFYPVGVTNNLYIVTDGAGLKDSCTIKVTVLDNQLPQVVCPANISVYNDPGLCGAVINYTVPVGYDNCANASTALTGGLGSGSLFPVGITGETYTVTDLAGNTATCSFSITVIDHEWPQIACPPDTTVRVGTGSCSAIVNYLTPVGLDNCAGALTTLKYGIASGQAFPLGNTLVRYLVTDVYNHVDSCDFHVTVVDDQLPVIVCPNAIVQNNDPGACGAVVNYAIPVGTDNCSGATTVMLNGYASGASFPVGTTLVEYRVTDAGGNQAHCSFPVNVVDAEAPAISCQAPITLNSDPGGCGTHVTYIVPEGTDNCAFPTTIRLTGLGSGAFFPVGTTENLYQVTDASGNQSSCSVRITILDNEAPGITCPANIVVNADAGQCGAIVTYTPPVGLDNCGGATTLQNRGLGTGSFFPVGSTAENFVVTDSAGNQDSCSFAITVIDNQLPVIACPANIVQPADAGTCGAVVNYATPIGTDNCDGDTTILTKGLPSGATFSIGTTLVRYLAYDAHGNIDSCDFVIRIEDLQVPEIVCPANIVQNNTPGQCGSLITYNTPVGTDNCAGIQTLQVTGLPSGALFPVGVTSNMFVVTDAVNQADTCIFLVTIHDVEAPHILCPADPVVMGRIDTCGQYVNYIPPVGNDNCGGSTTALISGLGNGNFFPVGLTTETYMVTDGAGLRDTCSFVVHVIDQNLPNITCPANLQVNNDAGQCGAIVTYVTPSGVDQCGTSSTVQVQGLPSASLFPLGTTTLTFSATDSSGNTANCSFEVTVIDNEAPVVTCPADIQIGTDTGTCSALVTYTATASDNCPGVSIAYSHASGSTFGIGTTPVNVVATAANGDTSQCHFHVTVADDEAPVVSCPVDIQVGTDAGSCSAVVSFTATATDNCSGVHLSYNHASGSVFGVGVTEVVVLATATNGDTAQCQFQVTVSDDENPVVACPANIQASTDTGTCGATISFAATTSDNCTATTLTYSQASGTVFPLGTTTVNVTAQDGTGNTTTCTFEVAVSDNEAPVVTCPANIQASTDTGACGATVSFAATATDNCTATTLTYSHASGSVFPLGTTTVNVTAQDGTGNTTICSFEVTVSDDEAPVVTCPANIQSGTDTGTCGATISFAATATDNCTATTLTYSHASGSVFPLGTTTVNVTAQDGTGNTTICSFEVTVSDDEAPVVTCPANIQSGTDTGTCGAAVSFAATATDNCTATTLTYSHASGSVFAIGTTTVNVTAQDGAGNTTTCSFEVTVSDDEAPVITCPADIQASTDPGACGAVVTFTATATDNCTGAITLNYSLASGSVFAVGNTTVVVSGLDAAGNQGQCSFEVVVTDTAAPLAVCQNAVVYLDAAGNATLTAAMLNGGSTDACGGTTFNLSQTAFDCGDVTSVVPTELLISEYVEGIINNKYLELYNPTSSVKNLGDYQLRIYVNGSPTPTNVVTLSGSLAPGATRVYRNATATAYTGPTTVLSIANWTGNDALALYNLSTGEFVDIFGRIGDDPGAAWLGGGGTHSTLDRTLRRKPNVLQGVTTNPTAVGTGGFVTLTTEWIPSALNDVSGLGSHTTVSVGNTVTLTVTDVNGNQSHCTAMVMVQDTVAPQALCRNATVYLNTNGTASLAASNVNNGSSDACGIAVMSLDRTTFGCADVGVQPLVLTVTDVNGNTATCNATVTVMDSVVPVALCQNVSVYLDGNGQANLTAAMVNAGSSDNCGIAGMSMSDYSFDCSDLIPVTVPQDLFISEYIEGSTTNQCVELYNGTGASIDLSAGGYVLEMYFNGGTTPGTSIPLTGTVAAGDVYVVCMNAAGTAMIAQADQTYGGTWFDGGDAVVLAKNGGANRVDVFGRIGDAPTFGGWMAGTLETEDRTLRRNRNIRTGVNQNPAVGFPTLITEWTGYGIDDASNLGSHSLTNEGAQLVTLTLTDVFGNTNTCRATVTVIDTVRPVAECQNLTLTLGSNGQAHVTASQVNNGSSDNCGLSSLQLSGVTTFDCGDVGTTQGVTLVVEDGIGNLDSCRAQITISDPGQACNQAPVAVCQDVTVNADQNCEAHVAATSIASGSSDPDQDPLTYTLLPAGPYGLGTTPVLVIVADAYGAVDTCSALITVVDQTAPVALCQNLTLILDSNNTAQLSASHLDHGSHDNCGIVSWVASQTLFDCSDLGANTVTLTVTDSAGNAGTCSATVTIQDTVPPVALCQNGEVFLDGTGHATLSVAQIDSGSYDNCGIASIVLSQTAYDCAFTGYEPVTLTVTDIAGNVATCTGLVYVWDTIRPLVVCQNLTVALSEIGFATITPAQVLVSASDNCYIVGTTLSDNAFYCSEMGVHTVVLTAHDNNGNSSTCISTVTVVDTAAPAITCSGNVTYYSNPGQCGVSKNLLQQPVTEDNCGLLSLSNDAPTLLPVGQTTVTWTVVDNALNAGACSLVVTVLDTLRPSFAGCPLNLTVAAGANCQGLAYWNTPSASDACGVTMVASHTSGSSFPVGTTTVTYVATDPSGNAATCSFNVTVFSSNLSASASVTTPISCNGGNNGVATVNAAGNCQPYTYLWSNGQTTAAATGLGAGTYTVTVTAAGGATATASVTLTQPAALVINGSVINATCSTSTNGAAYPSAVGGTGTRTYLWSTGATTQNLTGLAPGSYTVTVTDSRGCTAVRTFTVNFTSTLVANAGTDRTVVINSGPAPDPVPCVNLQGSASGVTGTLLYAWSPTPNTGATSATANVCPTVNTTYTLTVTTATGCISTDQVNVTVVDQATTQLPYVAGNTNKVYVCRNGVTSQVNVTGPCTSSQNLCWMLNNGATLGSCPAKLGEGDGAQAGDAEAELSGDLEAMPNPFVETTTLRFWLDADDVVDLKVYSLTGVQVAALYTGEVYAGVPMEVRFEGNGLADGIYFARLESRMGVVKVLKIVLQR